MVNSDTRLFGCKRLQTVFSGMRADCQQSQTKTGNVRKVQRQTEAHSCNHSCRAKYIYLLQLGCHPVAVVILHLKKI